MQKTASAGHKAMTNDYNNQGSRSPKSLGILADGVELPIRSPALHLYHMYCPCNGYYSE